MKVKIYKLKNREPEIWVSLNKDCRIKPIYEISSYGRVRNNKGLIMGCEYDKDDYVRYTLQGYKKKIKISAHRLVGLHYINNPNNKPEINHIRVIRTPKGNRAVNDDNYYKNLEWCTRMENIQHSMMNKLEIVRDCEDAGRAIFSNDVVHFICLQLEKGKSNKEIREMLLIPKSDKKMNEQYRGLIKHVKSRKHWVKISDFYNF